MKQVTCKSGIKGSRERLSSGYKDFEEFKCYSDIYCIAERLGYDSPEDAWKDNPVIESSVIPSDLRVVA